MTVTDRYAAVRRDLHRAYDDKLSPQVIDEVLDTNIARAEEHATVKDFLPVTVGRATVEDLADMAADGHGGVLKERPEVLFVSAHNAGRAQLAAALAQHLAGDGLVVRSVGLDGGTTPSSEVISVLEERGIPREGLYRKGINPRTVHLSDVIVLIGVTETPNVPGKRYVHWPIEDPVGASPDKVRAIADEIGDRVRALLAELGVLRVQSGPAATPVPAAGIF